MKSASDFYVLASLQDCIQLSFIKTNMRKKKLRYCRNRLPTMEQTIQDGGMDMEQPPTPAKRQVSTNWAC